MKKFICIAYICLLLISLCSCGTVSSGSYLSNIPSNFPQASTKQQVFDVEKALSQLETKSYLIENEWTKYVIVTIKNNSEYNLKIAVDVNFYDENDALIGVDSQTQEAVESGHETLFWFIADDETVSFDGEYSIQEETWYDCVLSDLSYETTDAKDKMILSVTNNGNKSANFVQAYVIFFRSTIPVGFDWTYITDSDSEIKPGKTVKKEMTCYEPFDSYLVFFAGRR